jgi:hypothetical protein
VAGEPVTNCDDVVQENDYDAATTIGATNSLGGSVTTTFVTDAVFTKASLAISAHYDHTWHSEKKWEHSVHLKVKARPRLLSAAQRARGP